MAGVFSLKTKEDFYTKENSSMGRKMVGEDKWPTMGRFSKEIGRMGIFWGKELNSILKPVL